MSVLCRSVVTQEGVQVDIVVCFGSLFGAPGVFALSVEVAHGCCIEGGWILL